MQSAASLLDQIVEIDGVKVISAQSSASTAELLRTVGDWLRDKLETGVVVAGAVINDNPMLVAMVTKDVVQKGVDASTCLLYTSDAADE